LRDALAEQRVIVDEKNRIGGHSLIFLGLIDQTACLLLERPVRSLLRRSSRISCVISRSISSCGFFLPD